jgi:hypothetical protein
MEFNTNITQWKTIEALLKDKGIHHWNVTDQWDRTEYPAKYNGKPFAMMLLQLHIKLVILVWGNSKFYSIEPRHTINAIATALPKVRPLK